MITHEKKKKEIYKKILNLQFYLRFLIHKAIHCKDKYINNIRLRLEDINILLLFFLRNKNLDKLEKLFKQFEV